MWFDIIKFTRSGRKKSSVKFLEGVAIVLKEGYALTLRELIGKYYDTFEGEDSRMFNRIKHLPTSHQQQELIRLHGKKYNISKTIYKSKTYYYRTDVNLTPHAQNIVDTGFKGSFSQWNVRDK